MNAAALNYVDLGIFFDALCKLRARSKIVKIQRCKYLWLFVIEATQ